MASTLLLRLFGGASLECDGERMTGAAMQRHRLALLALLATSPAGTMSRERLMAMLWPESDHAEARHLLNVAVHALRKALHEDALLSVGRDLAINPALLQCDVVQFTDALSRGDFEHAVGLYAGPFLDGFFLDDAAEFERWQDAERARLDTLYANALERLAAAAEGRGQASVAIGWWRRLVRHDQGNVRALLHLMEALEVVGARAEALSWRTRMPR
ncbi:MAG: BTAD domain-containing putative transcriptional regulator [Gemmatimonadaceae bacterium]